MTPRMLRRFDDVLQACIKESINSIKRELRWSKENWVEQRLYSFSTFYVYKAEKHLETYVPDMVAYMRENKERLGVEAKHWSGELAQYSFTDEEFLQSLFEQALEQVIVKKEQDYEAEHS